MNETTKRTHEHQSPSFFERLAAASPERAAKIRALSAAFTLEDQLCRIMEQEHISRKELAKKLRADKALVSRDLNGGLSEAKFGRIVRVADALDCDIISLVIPRSKPKRKKTLGDALKVLAQTAAL